jgi:nucleoid DNA-binding protein
VKKSRLARILAEKQKTSPAEAAEMLDRVVHRILRTIRGGAPAEWPGLGYFRPGAGSKVEFDIKPRRKPAPRKRP